MLSPSDPRSDKPANGSVPTALTPASLVGICSPATPVRVRVPVEEVGDAALVNAGDVAGATLDVAVLSLGAATAPQAHEEPPRR